MWLSLAFLLAWFGGEMAGAPRSARLVLFGVLATIAAIPTMLIISGDASALFESWQNAQTDRAWAGVESERIEALREVVVLELTNAQQLQQQQYDERMLRIETDQRLQLGYINAGRDEPMPDNFTAAVPAPANVAVRAFLKGCYAADGFNYPGDVNGPGGMLTRNPWTNQWKGQPWADDARVLMEKCVLERAGNGNQWALKYKTLADANAALPRI